MTQTPVKPHCPYTIPLKELNPFLFTQFCHSKLGVSPHRVISDIHKWLEEDQGAGDVTLFSAFANNPEVNFFIIAKQDFILSGLSIMQAVFLETSANNIKLFSEFKDGDSIKKGDIVIAGKGLASAILLAERVALNFSSKMSGIATKTFSISEKIRKISSQKFLLETRKTTPGLRMYEKYSTRVGGARNHRHGLDSGAMLKENHLRSIGTIEESLNYLQKNVPILTKIEIEVTNLDEFNAALEKKPDVIMLDNFSINDTIKAISLIKNTSSFTKLELSGNLDEKNIEEICQLDIDFLSMGALIHKATWVDMSLQIYLP